MAEAACWVKSARSTPVRPPCSDGHQVRWCHASSVAAARSSWWTRSGVVTRRLSALPSSPEVEELLARKPRSVGPKWALEGVAPAVAERDKLAKLVLKLHLDVAKLERQTATP